MTDLEAAELIRHMERWGYDMTEQPHRRSPGYERLIVAMRRTPTEEHYDPEAIHFHFCGAGRFPSRISVQMDTSLPAADAGHVCPGQIELTDRVNARRAFFTYGASIDRGSTSDETVIDIRSPVPILELSGSLDESIAEQLVSETEALWAKARAQWGTDESGFMQRLGSVPPAQLYASTIQSLWEAYQDSRILRQTFSQFYAMLRREHEWSQQLDGVQPSAQPLEELVQP